MSHTPAEITLAGPKLSLKYVLPLNPTGLLDAPLTRAGREVSHGLA